MLVCHVVSRVALNSLVGRIVQVTNTTAHLSGLTCSGRYPVRYKLHSRTRASVTATNFTTYSVQGPVV